MAVPILSHADIAAHADAIFRSHNPSQIIPLDIEHILDVDYGLEIYPRSGLMDRFQIHAFISADLTEIVVDLLLLAIAGFMSRRKRMA
jgi:dUTPase